MKVLACDTSTLLGSVALSDGDKILSSRSIQRAGSHSDTLNVMIRDCLDEAGLKLKDIDLFVSGLGPGSFTGIRISLNTIKTLAYIHHQPCAGLDSLYIIAAKKAQFESDTITVMINAFKNMVYIAEYAVNQKMLAVKPPQVVRVQELSNFLNPQSLILGDGFTAYESYFKSLNLKLKRPQDSSVDFPTATTLCHIYGQQNKKDFPLEQFHWSRLLPIYLRASEAEENLKGIKYIPLAMR